VSGTLPTANGGTNLTSFTANGVLYASSTSALATSSALTWDGTNLGVGGTGSSRLYVESASGIQALLRNPTASSYTTLRLYNNLNSNIRSLEIDYSGSTYSGALVSGGPSGEQAVITTTGAYPLVFGTANTSRAFFDSSGNFGIGTGATAPGARLDLLSTTSGMVARFKSTGAYGSVVADNTGTTGGGSFSARQNGTQYSIFGLDGAIQGNTSTDTAIFAETGKSLKFYTNGSPTVKATLDTAGGLTVGSATTIGTGKLSVFAGGASAVGWATGFNLGDASNYTTWIQDAGVSRFRNTGTGGMDWYNSSASAQIMSLSDAGNLIAPTGSMRAPIFYDSNDTTYYMDPAGTASARFAGYIGLGGNAYTTNMYGTTGISIYAASYPSVGFQNSSSYNFLIYKALLGDASDNLPGIRGLGPKKILKMFDLSGENELDLNDIYEISEDNVGTSNLHGGILESKQQLKINYQLMNIRTPNISDESKEDIIGSLNEEITPLNIGGFVMLYEADGLRNSIGNTHSWLAETFGSLILR